MAASGLIFSGFQIMIVIKTKCILSQMLITKTNWLHNYQAAAEWAVVQKAGSARGQCP